MHRGLAFVSAKRLVLGSNPQTRGRALAPTNWPRFSEWLASLLVLLLVVGCGSDSDSLNRAPSLGPLEDQRVSVNQPLSFSLVGSDPEGAPLEFRFSTNSAGITERATLMPAGSDAAVFAWTPQVPDIGLHVVDFSVSDGSSRDTRAVTIEVGPTAGSGAPVFRKPLGTGTTLDLAQRPCAEVSIEVEDPDSPGVTLGEAEPLIAGAEFVQDSGLTATWRFCPTAAQVQAEDIYTLRLFADDGDNPQVTKSFVVVLRKPQKANCPGEAPVIAHTPADFEGIGDISIRARVTDDVGIKFEPLLLFATTDPGTPPDLAQMTQLSLTRESGDNQDGEWVGRIPNPVAAAPQGTTAELYYLLVARDDDDQAADCDHLTQAPDTGSYQINVSSSGVGGGLAACEPCSADAQCGSAPDLCVQIAGAPHCLTACGASDVCPSGYTCSASNVTSEGGTSARQCIPDAQTCSALPPPCVDDAFEENDSLTTAKPLPQGDTLLVSCPAGQSDDEDWFELNLTQSGQLVVDLLGDEVTDLDLALYDNTGKLLLRSSGLTSEESLTGCFAAGRYYARVSAYGVAKNDYLLNWSVSPMTCAVACDDDSEEDDDDAVGARAVDLDSGVYRSQTNAICPYDEDWYELELFSGETLHSTLSFSQASPAEDLDLLLYQGTTLLTRCTELDVSGCSENGQSSTSNETFSWSVSQGGTYYLVVRGYAGAQNLYDLCIGLEAGDCP